MKVNVTILNTQIKEWMLVKTGVREGEEISTGHDGIGIVAPDQPGTYSLYENRGKDGLLNWKWELEK